MVSTDDGMEIDASNEQFSNADFPKVEIRQKASNVTFERELMSLKHPIEIDSMSLPMLTWRSSAGQRTSDLSRALIRKGPETFKI
jgi:hypothetical protein